MLPKPVISVPTTRRAPTTKPPPQSYSIFRINEERQKSIGTLSLIFLQCFLVVKAMNWNGPLFDPIPNCVSKDTPGCHYKNVARWNSSRDYRTNIFCE